MSWLKQIATWIVAGVKLELGLSNVVQQQYPQTSAVIATINSELTQIADIITTVQAVGYSLGLPGDQKARAAGPLLNQAILKSAFMVGKEVADPVANAKAAEALAGAFADYFNTLKAPEKPA